MALSSASSTGIRWHSMLRESLETFLKPWHIVIAAFFCTVENGSYPSSQALWVSTIGYARQHKWQDHATVDRSESFVVHNPG